ncbi:MAG: hypothetical protein ABSE54_05065 [Smithella sp.]
MSFVRNFMRSRFSAREILLFLFFYIVTFNMIFLYNDYLHDWRSGLYTAIGIAVFYFVIGTRWSLRLTVAVLAVTLALVTSTRLILPKMSLDNRYFDFTRGHIVYQENSDRSYSFPGGDLV